MRHPSAINPLLEQINRIFKDEIAHYRYLDAKSAEVYERDTTACRRKKSVSHYNNSKSTAKVTFLDGLTGKRAIILIYF